MVQRTVGDVTYELAFDTDNRLMTVTNTTTGDVTRLVYDGDGVRVKKVASGVTNRLAGVGRVACA